MKVRIVQTLEKRITASTLALVILFISIFSGITFTFDSQASTFSSRGNLWRGEGVLLGKSRNYLYRWNDGKQEWAITAGEWHNVDSILATVNKHVPGTATEWVLRNIIV